MSCIVSYHIHKWTCLWFGFMCMIAQYVQHCSTFMTLFIWAMWVLYTARALALAIIVGFLCIDEQKWALVINTYDVAGAKAWEENRPRNMWAPHSLLMNPDISWSWIWWLGSERRWGVQALSSFCSFIIADEPWSYIFRWMIEHKTDEKPSLCVVIFA